MGEINKIIVNLGKRSYPIYIGNDIFTEIPRLFEKAKVGKKVLLVTNPTIAKLHSKMLIRLFSSLDIELNVLNIPLAEKNKNLKTVEKIYNELAKLKFERNSSIIALGGGVIGDVAGYAAATYLRGINFFQIPTTLLAQVDSSVGGKTAVNLSGTGKNLVGAFYQPKAVFIDISTLATLPEREWLCGLAEVIKYGVIWDKKLFSLLEKEKIILGFSKNNTQFNTALVLKIIKRCCEIKAKIVSHDEKEKGLRAILNYGHTAGHAIEIASNHYYNHGEAVALGMLTASYIAENLGFVDVKFVERQKNIIKKIGLPIALKKVNYQTTINLIKSDKKVQNNTIKFILPQRIGKVTIFKNVPNGLILKALKKLKS